jgi:hypothetical protein
MDACCFQALHFVAGWDGFLDFRNLVGVVGGEDELHGLKNSSLNADRIKIFDW